jgi:hypothetical protein
MISACAGTTMTRVDDLWLGGLPNWLLLQPPRDVTFFSLSAWIAGRCCMVDAV